METTEKLALKVLDLIRDEAGGADKVDVTLGLVGVHPPNYPINLIYLWNGGSDEAVLQVQFKLDSKLRMEPFKERLRARLPPRCRMSVSPLNPAISSAAS